KKGEETATLLPGMLNSIFQAFPWPKPMRWGASPERWVRPLQGILCLLDDEAVEDVGFGDIRAGDSTVGHPFLRPGTITAKDFADYKSKLEEARVLIDPAGRKARILEQIEGLAAEKNLHLLDDPALLNEVAGLVEWPVALMGGIDPEFMKLPPEVLTTSMRKHQKYFALTDKDGNLAPYFITVADTETEDAGAQVTAGNERVLRARLADARFFWDTDRQTPLEDRLGALAQIVFHAKLGSLADKMIRVENLAGDLAGHIEGADAKNAARAAQLAKADLSTGMVGEFPDLQGLMGRYYALNDGESDEVAGAIADHYSPQGPGDSCPSAPISIAVALADKIDTLVSFWSIDEKPTGSKDPFALRRAALGVIRLILENEIRLSLTSLFGKAADFDAA
ncbi:MAG: glycine--tRNA ligase subunit beta, partial [Rhodospirillales bacterium]|nr:glycine--tRNA ligase subunit beta [Rhodospirillales bacterium]